MTIEVAPTHPSLQLAQVISWPALAEQVLPDLKQSTAQGKWWLGRSRRLSKDFEHQVHSSEAMVYLASIHRMLRLLDG